MNNEEPQDVTPVTRNKQGWREEIKLLLDLLSMAATVYYLSHPDCLDDMREKVSEWRGKVVHKVSVWTARQDIRSLPETDDE
jgi:hypothetical protein